MGKQKQSPSKDGILQTRLTHAMKRESENALARYYLDRNVEAKDATDMELTMRSLLKYLKEEHARWQPLGEAHMNTASSTMVRAMRAHLFAFRKKVEDLEELMEAQADRKDSHDVRAEVQGATSCSCEES